MKLTKLEKSWILYDVGNSAFTLLVSTIMPIYFNYLAGAAGLSDETYLAYWGYAASISTLLVALSAPVLGTMADYKGFKKPIFFIAMAVGAVGCIALGLAKMWLAFLVIFVIAKTGYAASLVFYDAMLTDVTGQGRMDVVSALGYAWGYVGSCLPFLACLGLVLGAGKLGLTMETAMGLSFAVVAIWWVGCALPLCGVTASATLSSASPTPSAQASAAWPRPLKMSRRKSTSSSSSWPSSFILTASIPSSTWPRPTARLWGSTPRGFSWRFS